MNQIDTSLEDLLIAACGHARAVSEGLQATCVGRRARDAHAVSRCISGLETGDLLRSDLNGYLAARRRPATKPPSPERKTKDQCATEREKTNFQPLREFI